MKQYDIQCPACGAFQFALKSASDGTAIQSRCLVVECNQRYTVMARAGALDGVIKVITLQTKRDIEANGKRWEFDASSLDALTMQALRSYLSSFEEQVETALTVYEGRLTKLRVYYAKRQRVETDRLRALQRVEVEYEKAAATLDVKPRKSSKDVDVQMVELARTQVRLMIHKRVKKGLLDGAEAERLLIKVQGGPMAVEAVCKVLGLPTFFD